MLVVHGEHCFHYNNGVSERVIPCWLYMVKIVSIITMV